MRRATAAALTAGGRLNGPLHAFRADFLDRMVARGIRLPLGTYWGDGLLGSMVAHDLDPLANPWDNARMPTVAAATFEIKQLSPFSPDDIRRQFRREIRQMCGRIQNAAIGSIIYRAGYEGLPDNADDMIRSYLAANPPPAVPLSRLPFQWLAIRQSRRAVRPDPDRLVPHPVPVA